MKVKIKIVAALAMLWLSLFTHAYDFAVTNSNYDFTQTVEILVIDEGKSKFYGMMDPFEIQMTTIPSRFYVAIMNVIKRGHAGAPGVSTISNQVAGYTYTVIFRSPGNSYVIFVGPNWLIDGNKKIILSPEEIAAIYEVLTKNSNSTEPTDLKSLEGLFSEIEQQQVDNKDSYSAENELNSIDEASQSITERLPENQDDIKALPHYDKSMQNEKFRETLEKNRKLNRRSSLSASSKKNDSIVDGYSSSSIALRIASKSPPDTSTVMPKQSNNNFLLLWIIAALIAFLAIYWLFRRS